MTVPQVLYGVNQRLRVEDVDSPLCDVRPVKVVLLTVLTGDRGLCGGYNNFIIKKVRGQGVQVLHSGAAVRQPLAACMELHLCARTQRTLPAAGTGPPNQGAAGHGTRTCTSNFWQHRAPGTADTATAS